jgi:DNA-directed RNA polymerase specialized sigma subunit
MDMNNPETLWKEWKTKPTSENLSRVVKSFEGLANTAAGQQKSINPSLLKSKARLLTAEAVKTFDPMAGAKLSTHVFNHLRPLNRSAKDMVEIAPLSRYYSDEGAKMIGFIQNFSEENGREPDDLEIQDALGIGKKRMEKLNKTVKYEIPESQVVGDVISDSEDTESDMLNLWTEYIYNDLDLNGRKILNMKTGRNGHPIMSNEEIAVKLNMTPVDISNRASRIANSILKGMNTRERSI